MTGRRQCFNSASTDRLRGLVSQAIGDEDRSTLYNFCYLLWHFTLRWEFSPHTSWQDWNGTARGGHVSHKR